MQEVAAMARSLRLMALVGLLSLLQSPEAHGYALPGPWGSGDDQYYEKWGDIYTPGSTAGTLTWSIAPDGTGLDPAFPNHDVSGVSSLHAIMNNLGYAAALAAIERCFDRWAAATNVYFVPIADTGVAFGAPTALWPNTGHIRLGAFPISNFSGGGIGYGVSPFGSAPLDGDLILNANSTFFFDDGAEGELIDQFNDFESLMMHEIGHTLGLGHSEVPSVMSVDWASIQYVNRELDPDDIAGIQFLYGPALKADFQQDNDVDAGDLGVWKGNFGLNGPAAKENGDANSDGRVDGSDFLVWQRECFPPAAATSGAATVPEAAAMPLASAALLGLAAWRRFSMRALQ